MPTIEIAVSERIQRHLAAVRLMSFMVFPEDAEKRALSEITFRTILAGWYSGVFAGLERKVQEQIVRQVGRKVPEELPRALAEPASWMTTRIFEDFLESTGGANGSALALTGSPSADELREEWTRRWWSIVYTGKILALIASVAQYHSDFGASVNKAIHILCETEGGHKPNLPASRQPGFPRVYESSLKKAWVRFKPVAPLCAAYITTETHYYEGQLSSDFWEYWKEPPAFYQDEIFQVFCIIAKSAERFATSFFPRGQRQPLIPKEEIFALPDEIFEPGIALPVPRALTEEEFAALKSYRAPKRLV